LRIGTLAKVFSWIYFESDWVKPCFHSLNIEKTELACPAHKVVTSPSPRLGPMGGYYQSQKGVIAKKHSERTSSIYQVPV